MKVLAAFALSLLPLSAEVVQKDVIYKDGDTVLEGSYTTPAGEKATKGVLIVHQWTGLTDYEKGRAAQLAELGYAAFALDIYGQGIRPKPPKAGKFAGEYKNNRILFRQRLMAGLTEFKKQSGLADHDIAAIGYCFGGTGVLEIARAGTPIAGVISFHGGLGTAPGLQAKTVGTEGGVETKVLALHGQDDPHVPEAEVAAFKAEMDEANVDWAMQAYPDAVHAFTQPMAGDDNSKGAAYNKTADELSWLAMQEFFNEIFAETE